MSDIRLSDPEAGARNLLRACLNAQPGERLLILYENPDNGFYDERAPIVVAEQAEAMGLSVHRREVPLVDDARDADPGIWDEMQQADRIVFFARLGDQIRFDALPAASRAAVVYALDEDMLGSRFGVASHDGFVELLGRINNAVANAAHIRLTCPLGTDLFGRVAAGSPFRDELEGEVKIRRFPMAVFKPVPADEFSGQIVISRFLTGTGHRYYTPYDLLLERPVVAQIASGRVVGYDGAQTDVDRVLSHTRMVGDTFAIDPEIVHSWHAGMHPGCAYLHDGLSNLARWGNAAFANPRILHFHTCGNYAPGEISWNIIDPTIELDGIAVWQDGRLHPDRIEGGAEILLRWPDVGRVFAEPRSEIGL